MSFIIPKDSKTKAELVKDLTIIPYNPKPEFQGKDPINLYNGKVPRCYASDIVNIENQLNVGEKVDIGEFKGDLRDYQQPVYQKTLNHLKESKCHGGILSVYCGYGKCLGKGSEVFMYDESTKKVEDIQVGDLLMGNDMEPRKVLSLARGKEDMYMIQTPDNFQYSVNRSHILVLKRPDENKYVQITVSEHLSTLNGGLFPFRIPVKFSDKTVTVDPYKVGLCLNRQFISGKHYYLSQIGHFTQIPNIYKYGSVNVRLRLLKGLLAGLGNSFVVKDKQLSDDIIFIARSLSLPIRVYVNRISISVNFNDFILKPNTYDMNITEIGVGDYYGFELDGNSMFLLGDFTVTHNTTLGLKMISDLNCKTLVVCHTTSLMDQWTDAIHNFLPKVKVGKIQQDKVDIQDKQVVVSIIHSLSMKEYLGLNVFGFVILDEIHLMCTQVFSRAFPKICNSYYILGLSATPYRQDKCEKVFEYCIGPIIHYERRERDSRITAYMVKYKNNFKTFLDKRGKPVYTSTIMEIIGMKERTELIVSYILQFAELGRHILVLSDYVDHLKTIGSLLDKYEGFTYGYFIGEKNNEQRKEAQTKDVILGTSKLASVGMDVKILDTLILASPKKGIEQSVGRILRGGSGMNPVIIDINDDHFLLKGQYRIKKEFYQKFGYVINEITVDKTGQIKEKFESGRCLIIE